MRGLRSIDDFPAVVIVHLALLLGQAAVRVVQDQTGAQRGEGRVDVDGIRVTGEVDGVHAVIGEVATQPFDAFEVCREPVLNHQVLAKAQDIGSVKQRLFLGGDKELLGGPLKALGVADFVAEIIGVIIRIGQARFGRALVPELRVLVEIPLHERAVVQILEPAAAVGHGCFQHLGANGQQYIAGRHTAKLAVSVEIRRGGRQRMVDTGGAVHTHAALLQHACKVIEQLVRAVDGFLRAAAPLAAHIAVFGHFCIQRRFFGWDVAIVGTAHNYMLQRIPLIPAVYDCLLHDVPLEQCYLIKLVSAKKRVCKRRTCGIARYIASCKATGKQEGLMALWELDGVAIATKIRKGEVTAREATEATLARMDAVNSAINAVVARDDEAALVAADAVDAARADGAELGPIAGVPVTIKENVDQTGCATTNGLLIQKDLVATQDNPVVANLRRAGAVIVGRTNTPAFSLRWFTRNSLHGHTRNPHNPRITPGGSSGGAAAATAAGIGAMGHGTDIGGSIRYPAYACGLQGIRPTLGRVAAWNPSSPDRHIGAQLMAVSGPHARTVRDVRTSLAVMSQPDLRDPWQMPVPLVGAEYPRRAALCVSPEGLQTHPLVEQALRDTAARLIDAGWRIDEVESPPFREPARLQAQLWLAEMARGATAAFAAEDDPDANHVLAEMHKLTAVPDLNGVLDALQARVGFVREWQMFLEKYPVLICPISSEPPFPDLLDLEDFPRVIEAQLTQVGLPLLGLPGMSVFTGFGESDMGRVPLGAQLIGGRYREDILLDAAEAIEARGEAIKVVTP